MRNPTRPAGWLPEGWRPSPLLFALLSMALCIGTAAGPVEMAGELAARWTGRWVVITSELSSGCADVYTNNRIHGGEVQTGRGGWERKLQQLGRFMVRKAAQEDEALLAGAGLLSEERTLGAGELGTVHRVKVTGDRVDLLVDLAGRVLLPREHGPYTLYREAHCKVQLQFEMPRSVVKRGTIDEVEEILARTVELYASEAEARGSEDWNGRGDDAYPPDYEDTLRAFTSWRNAEVDRALEEALAMAAEMGASLSSSSSYYDGFFRGAGVIDPALRHLDCDGLVSQSFESLRRRPGMGEVATRSKLFADVTIHDPDGSTESLVVFDAKGYEDGQRLLFALAMLARLPECRLPGESGT